MTELLQEYHLTGLAIGLITFLIIGLFHPIVINAHYYFSTRCWWWFLLLGLATLAGSILVSDLFWSVVLGVFGFSSLWSIGEIFEQQKRVDRGWFPANPRHKRS